VSESYEFWSGVVLLALGVVGALAAVLSVWLEEEP
jgi:hypothetical protein